MVLRCSIIHTLHMNVVVVIEGGSITQRLRPRLFIIYCIRCLEYPKYNWDGSLVDRHNNNCYVTKRVCLLFSQGKDRKHESSQMNQPSATVQAFFSKYLGRGANWRL